MLTIVWAGVRHRAASLLAVVVAAGLGSALLVVCGAMFETGIRLSAPPERVTDADLMVIGDPSYTMLDAAGRATTDRRPFPERHRLSSTLVADVQEVDGVARAVPVQLFDVAASGATGAVTLTGQNWASVALSGIPDVDGIDPAADEAVLTTTAARALHVAEGDTFDATVAGRSTTVRVHAVIGGPGDPATMFLAGAAPPDGRLDAVGVDLAAGAERSAVHAELAARLTDVRVLAGDHRGAAEDPAVPAARIPTIVIGAVAGGIVVTVLATVTSGIVALSVRQRSREVSLLRATGATGRQARALLVGEASVAGTVGALLGLALGIPLSHALLTGMRTGGLVPEGLQLRVGLIPFAVAVATTTLTVWLSAHVAARPALRSRAIDALRESELPRARVGVVRWVLGVLFMLLAVALAVVSSLMPPALVSATAGPGVLAGAISAALLAPVHLRLLLALLGPLLGRHRRGLGGLAHVNVHARTASLSTVTGATALVVGLCVGNLVSQTMLTTTAARAQVETVTAHAVVHGPAGTVLEHAADIAALPEVHAVSPFVASGGWIEDPYDPTHRDRPWPLRGLDGRTIHQVLGNRLTGGELTDLTGQSIALPTTTADLLAVTVGDSLRFRFGDGAGATLRVVATYTDLPGYEHLILPADLLAEHTTARAPTTLLVTATEGRTDALMGALGRAVGDDSALTLGDREALEGSFRAGLDVNALVNTLMLLVVLTYAMIAVVNTVAVSTLGRRRELAMLRLAGATRPQVRTLLVAETALAAAAGIATGLVVAGAAVLPTALVVGATPFAPLPMAITATTVIAVVVLTLPVTALAARRATSGRPADAITRTA